MDNQELVTAPAGDPGYLKNRDLYFLTIAEAVGVGSTHPLTPGGCIIVRDREIIGSGRQMLSHSKVEIDCVSAAIGASCKLGTPAIGGVVYSTRYPFPASVMQMHLMGIKRIVIQAHDWEPLYKQEFRKAARLARELGISVEPLYKDPDPRFASNPHKLDAYDEPQPEDQA